jgi:hypothetical protein
MSKFKITENGKQIGQVRANNVMEALKRWAEFAGPGNYKVSYIGA